MKVAPQKPDDFLFWCCLLGMTGSAFIIGYVSAMLMISR